MESGEWVLREKSILKARLPHKRPTYNSISMPTRALAGEKLSNAERLSRANMNSAVYATILKYMQPHRVVGSFV